MSKELPSNDQLLEEYTRVVANLKNPHIGGLGYIGQSALHIHLMKEIISRQLLPQAIEIESQQL